MANIEQVVKIQSNRAGAVSDVYSDLSGSAAITGLADINIQHLPTGTGTNELALNGTADTALVRAGSGVSSTTLSDFQGTGATLLVREGSDGTTVIRRSNLTGTGSNINVDSTTGAVSVTLPEISPATNIRTFTTVAARNASTAQDWKQGDIAIVTSDPTSDNNHTYIFTGTAQDTPAATTNADWTIVNPAGIIDWAQPRSGSDQATIDNTRVSLATYQDSSDVTRTLSTLSVSGETLTISDGMNPITFTGGSGGSNISDIRKNVYRTQVSITSGTTDLTITVPIANFNAVANSGSVTRPSTFPNSASFYVDGIKLFLGPSTGSGAARGDYQIDAGRTVLTITVPQSERPGAGEDTPTGILEMETLSFVSV